MQTERTKLAGGLGTWSDEKERLYGNPPHPPQSTECCDDMKRELDRRCPDHPDRFDCGDMVIHKTERGRYGLMIHDGGSSFYRIWFCPWCGSRIGVQQ